jgi:hypothetical protein
MSLSLPDGIGYSDVPEAVNVVSEGMVFISFGRHHRRGYPPWGSVPGDAV